MLLGLADFRRSDFRLFLRGRAACWPLMRILLHRTAGKAYRPTPRRKSGARRSSKVGKTQRVVDPSGLLHRCKSGARRPEFALPGPFAGDFHRLLSPAALFLNPAARNERKSPIHGAPAKLVLQIPQSGRSLRDRSNVAARRRVSAISGPVSPTLRPFPATAPTPRESPRHEARGARRAGAQPYASIYAILGYVYTHDHRHDQAREAYRLARR